MVEKKKKAATPETPPPRQKKPMGLGKRKTKKNRK